MDANSRDDVRETTRPWGQRLREERIRRGMSVAEVAATLHLETGHIEAIEAEACERLPNPSFVKGYLRNYAKLLEVDADPLVEAYSQVCGSDEPALKQVARIEEVSAGAGAPRHIGWLVVLGLLLSALFWWWSYMAPSTGMDTETDNVSGTLTPSFTPEIDAPLEPAPVLAPGPEQSSADRQAAAPELPEPELPPPAAEPEAPQTDTLTLHFADDSWVEIEDGEGRRLFVDLARAGQTRSVDGRPPFRILLGNAPAVTLEVNGEVYDHAGHNRQGVARFTLDQ